MFADEPLSYVNNELSNASEAIARVSGQAAHAIISILTDPCNIFAMAVDGIRGYRNPDCAPKPQPPPPPGAVKTPGICGCAANITFGCTVTDNSPDHFTTVPGMGFLEYIATGAAAPSGVEERNPRGSQVYVAGNERNTVYAMNGANASGALQVYYFSRLFTEEQQRHGYVNTQLPTLPDGRPLAWGFIHIECQGCKFEPTISPPPPPPPEKECDCMSCCPEIDDTLLKLILKRIGTLPVDVPASYLTKNGVQPAQVKKVESLTEFIAWFAERFDETVGEFEVTIEVNDADLTKQGEQKQTIRLPNLAESIAEMFSLMIHCNINNELILNIVNRTLIESGQIKQSEYKTISALHALIDYLGFPTHTTTEKMPLTFKPGELSFDKLLKESNIDVSVLTYTEKPTLAATLHTLLQAAAIIRASHFRGTPGNKAQVANIIKEDLKKLLGEGGDLLEQIKTFVKDVNGVYDAVDHKLD
ncbi:hypothetical protein [Nostoc sp.]|uniref:hypothetical protein n=1 Tax=Nostoc sp. TaxID=1180 RepID=UPI002FFCDB5E